MKRNGADFHINLGDWFEGRVGHCITETTAVYDYIKTKAYQGTRCWPTYFALGNHEGENPTQDAYHLNARSARMKVLPNPDASVSSFYKNPNPYQSYYAWEWGDALFIVLDPYSYCKLVARRRGLRVEIQSLSRSDPVRCAPRVMAAVTSACSALRLRQRVMQSAAGHDPQNLAHITPAGMVFIPSRGGRSHRPDEVSDDRAVARGANVLLRAPLTLAA